MREHIKLIGILHIVFGCLGVLLGIALLVFFGGIAAMLGLAGNDRDFAAAGPILTVIGTGIAIFLFVLSAPSIVGGWGLIKFRPWARVVVIILSAIDLLHFPIGTALGIYGLITLLSEEAKRLFETGGTYVPPGPPAYGYAPYGTPPAPQASYQPPTAPPNYPPAH